MKRLLLADIHANLPALEAVLRHARRWDEVWVMGDITCWGPNPGECIDILRDIGAVCVLGNHDMVVNELVPGAAGNFYWDEWTRLKLSDEQLCYMRALPEYRIHNDASGARTVLMHELPPVERLPDIYTPASLARGDKALHGERVVFGHYHVYNRCVYRGVELLSLPALGQQRDASPDAWYVVEENGALTDYRVPYDTQRLARDLKTVGLDPELLERWTRFALTGYDKYWSVREGTRPVVSFPFEPKQLVMWERVAERDRPDAALE